MESTLIIKDLTLDKGLDRKAMSSVRGGMFDQANAEQQGNFQGMVAGVAVANGTNFGGSGPVNMQVTSNPTQTAWNSSSSANSTGFPYYYLF